MQTGINEENIQHIAFLTSCNCHGEAYQRGAEMLGCEKLAERFSNIEYQRQKVGHLSVELQYDRRKAYEEMMEYARTHMSEVDFQKFYMAF